MSTASSNRRGYAMPMVLILLLLLSGALTTALMGLSGSIAIGESALHRRQAFHAAEGAQVAAVELASQRLRSLPLVPALPPSDPGFAAAMTAMLAQQEIDVAAFVNTNSATFTAAPFTLKPVAISSLKAAEQKTIGGGPFAGMLAQVQSFLVKVSATREHDRSPATVTLLAEVERATISMFQFYVFSDSYLDLDPGGPVVATGRIHTNGDFCIAGEPIVDTVTSAGRILLSNPNSHGLCRRRAGESNKIQIAIDDSFTTFNTLTIDRTSAGWPAVESTFKRHLLDKTHNVGTLRMPLSGQPRVQAGANVLAMEQVSSTPTDKSLMVPIAAALEDNTTSMRFLVDPMLITEPDDVRRQKFAFKADLRIIDGVWYLRDPNDPADIGTAIWSDHPGTGSVAYDDNVSGVIIQKTTGVAQEEIRAQQSWPTTPQRYSYYGFQPDPTTGKLAWARGNATPTAVISYGLLHRVGGSVWKPGFYSTKPTAGSPGATALAATHEKFFEGTTTGIKNGWLEVRSETDAGLTGAGESPVETDRSRLLPINFDVAALTGALHTCTSGELGSHFPGTCTGSGRRFNGVVFVSTTWPGSMDGLGAAGSPSHGFAKLWPFNGHKNDQLENIALPMPVCSGAATGPGAFTDAVAGRRQCSAMQRNSANDQAFPSILRIINGAHISPKTSGLYAGVNIPVDAYPDGLTIATNLPVIAVGDMNIDTTPKKRATDPVPAGDHFVPFLIAGDRFHRHSVNWQDNLANWRQLMNANVRAAGETTQHLEILAGWNPTPTVALPGHDHSSDGFEDFPRYNEDWHSPSATPAHYFGSIVVAFASVYERSGANNADGHGNGAGFTTRFPPRDEGFDFHLQDPDNQPPGAPLILAQSVGFVGRR